MNIWKISHGRGSFSQTELDDLAGKRLVAMHRETKLGQGENFSKTPAGLRIPALFNLPANVLS